jgi:hypothetical protein
MTNMNRNTVKANIPNAIFCPFDVGRSFCGHKKNIAENAIATRYPTTLAIPTNTGMI